jgi:hypothetical protein
MNGVKTQPPDFFGQTSRAAATSKGRIWAARDSRDSRRRTAFTSRAAICQ